MNKKQGTERFASNSASFGERSVAVDMNFGIINTGDNATFEMPPIPSPHTVSASVLALPRPPTPVFLGRELEIEELTAIFSRNDNQMRIHVLHGLGGVGKTELALQYAHQKSDLYRTVWWISAESPDRIQLSLAELTWRLLPENRQSFTTESAALWALEWLASHRGWLLILDNVEKPKHIDGVLGHLSRGGDVLITSRRDVRWPGRATSKRLSVLDPEPSVQLVAQIAECAADIHGLSLHAIALDLGFLPLALDQAGAYIRQTRISPDQYLERLQRQPLKIYDASPKDEKEQETIARVWSITLETLMSEEPDSVALLYILAHFAPDDIPREIVGSSEDELEVDEWLGLLSSYSMISLSVDSIAIHRLVRQVLLLSLTASQVETEWIRANSLNWINEAIPDGPLYDIGHWPLTRRVVPHVYSVAELIPKAEESEALGLLLSKVGFFENAQGNYEGALALRRRALDIAEATLGPDAPNTVRALGNLAMSLQEVGQYSEALPLLKRALEISSHSAVDKSLIIVILGHLARVYSGLGRDMEALPILRRSLAYASEFYGPLHFETSIRTADLGSLYSNLGWVRDAFTLFKQSLHIARQELGEEHPITAMRMARVANSFVEIGRPEKAIRLCEEALQITRSAVGEQHRMTFQRMSDLANAYQASGRMEEAVGVQETALDIAMSSGIADQRMMADLLADLATKYSDLGWHEKAMKAIDSAIEKERGESDNDARKIASLKTLRKVIVGRSR